MELRRALLLFAIVLGLAAIASSITRPPERSGDETTATTSDGDAGRTTTARATPSATPAPGSADAKTVTLRFRSKGKPKTLELEQGRPATVLAEVQTPGQIGIPTLGLTDAAEPLTPASFDVFVTSPGRHRVVLEPADAHRKPSAIGTLRIVPPS